LSSLQSNQSSFGQTRSELQQLGKDLQSGNLTQAQTDFQTLSQSLNLGSQAASTSSVTSTNSSPLAQAFNQLGQDLQSGNLQAAQQHFTSVQQDVQQTFAQQAGFRHHHHSAAGSQNSSASTTQQTSAIAQEFSQLTQTLQAGNLQGAQQAFSSLQTDLQQLEGFAGSGTGGTSTPVSPGSLNVTA
jgi:soluble cytochrome b562